MTRWSLIVLLLGALLGTASPAQAVVLTPGIFRDAGLHYESGEGVEQDKRRAWQLYCVAALQGDATAAYRLGLMSMNGDADLQPDRSIAAGWFLRGAEYGDSRSSQWLERLQGVSRAVDPACPVDRESPDRETIKIWVKRLAPEYGIDPWLVLALISVESGFNPDALSPRNAHGLMQLLPTTAERFGVGDIRDPVQNIVGGLAYLRWLMEQYSGKLRLVLAAYNAGEQAVDSYARIPPYEETKRYVLRILAKYRKLTHPVDPLPITAIEPGLIDATGDQVVMLAPAQDTPQ